jgi:exodeoxyribonuclease V beta subunit
MTTGPALSPVPFDVCGPLPAGTTVLEASAGTGKTYTIAALAARYVAEGRAELSELMLVTFGRMASSELRTRVWERLVSLERALAWASSGSAEAGTPDEVERLLTGGDPAELLARRDRVRRALADFDAATVATTHEFCLHMLDGLGVLGDAEPGRRIVEEISDVTREAAGDVFLRRYAATGAPMTFTEALALAVEAVSAPHARLVPAIPPGEAGRSATTAYERVAYALEVRREVEHRKRAALLFSYDDMLTRLRDALTRPRSGVEAVARLRRRYSVVLVDEFQDTDPVQWEILRRAFHGHATMILIGDPKQAIYSFRGADVYSYLQAVGEADAVAGLGINWRCDAALLDALQILTGGTALGDPGIVVRPVEAAHRVRRMLGPTATPVRLRVVPHDPNAEYLPRVAALRDRIARDLVADVTTLLASTTWLDLAGGRRRLEPSDIAVLVRRNERAEAIRDALAAAGIPAVVLSTNSVFASPLASDWLTLLRALEQPRQGLIRAASLTCFVGWTFARLACAGDEELTNLTARIRVWSRLLSRRGVAALWEAINLDGRLTERLLAQVGGERRLTDLRHLAQSLHAAMHGGQLGVSALLEWLRERIDAAARRGGLEGSRRLDTDARCVQILTVHASKGLEFPVVYLPEAWDNHVDTSDDGRALRLHEARDGTRRDCVLDVGGVAAPGRGERLQRQRAEAAGEDLRLLYVALTRAQCQVVAWWAPSRNTPTSALQRFLYRARGDTDRGIVEPAPAYPVTQDPLGLALGDGIGVEHVQDRPLLAWSHAREHGGTLEVRAFHRVLDLEWRRTSYSALTAAAHGLQPGPAVGSEPELTREDDEPVDVAAPPRDTSVPADLGLTSPMAALPGGVEFGTLVHGVLEALDPAVPNLRDELRRIVAEQLSRSQPTGLAVDELADALLPALLTPLGPLTGGRALAGIGAADRLTELPFELPLTGGDRPRGSVRLADVAELLDRHLTADDPLAAYPPRLGSPLLGDQVLRGFLTGSIDAVLRIRDEGVPRYLVVDYKTNWLGEVDSSPLTLADYAPARLAQAMIVAHYPLQALLYSVALHRLLRWRQPGYDPDLHLGGIAYLFMRGLGGPQAPTVDGQPCGVFGWRPPPRLVTELSDLLDGDVDVAP